MGEEAKPKRSFGATLKALVTSRKFLVAVASAVVATGVIVAQWDETASTAMADKIVNVILIVGGLFIGATALEDAAAKRSGNGG